MSKEAEAKSAREGSASLKQSLDTKRGAAHELEQTVQELQKQQGNLRRQRDRSLDLVESRNQAIEAGVCPTCGTEMRGEIGEHVCGQVKSYEAQIALWDERLQQIKEELDRRGISIPYPQLDVHVIGDGS